eukprot:6570279-Prymnesium_polylepis.2
MATASWRRRAIASRSDFFGTSLDFTETWGPRGPNLITLLLICPLAPNIQVSYTDFPARRQPATSGLTQVRLHLWEKVKQH